MSAPASIFSDEAEKGIISCILQDPNRLDDLIAILTDEHFYHASHRTVWMALRDMAAASKPIDMVSVTGWLRVSGKLDEVGGASAVADYFTFVPAPTLTGYYTGILRTCYIQRACVRVGGELAQLANDHGKTDPDTPADELLAQAQKLTDGLTQHTSGDEMPSITFWMNKTIDELEERLKRGPGLLGYSTGLPSLDSRTNGIVPGCSYLIKGGTSDGKTALGLQISQALLDQNVAVGYLLCESSATALIRRAIANRMGVSLRRINQGLLTAHEQSLFARGQGELLKKQFRIVHRPGITLTRALALMRMGCKRYGIKAWVFDYLQRIDNFKPKENREQQVSEISRRITDSAAAMGCAAIMLSQVNDDGQTRESRAPDMDADDVWQLSCPVKKNAKGEVIEKNEKARLIKIAKARNEERGGDPLEFDFHGEYQRFEEKL